MTDSLEELLMTVENIRSDEYPDIPKELVEKVIRIEHKYEDDRTIATKKLSEEINNYIQQEDK